MLTGPVYIESPPVQFITKPDDKEPSEAPDSPMKNCLFLFLTASLISSCQDLHGGHTWEPTLSADYSVLGDYDQETDLEDPNGELPDELASQLDDLYLGVEFDYRVLQLEAGATKLDLSSGTPEKSEFYGFRLGFGTAKALGESLDILEFSGGGRWYFTPTLSFIPYLTAWSVITDFETGGSPQLGIRLGGGAEFPIDRVLAFRAELDYLFPIIEASASGIDFENSGLALRLGLTAYVP